MKDELINFLQNQEREELSLFIENSHPIDIANLLDELEDTDILIFYNLISIEMMATIFEQSNENLQTRIIDILGVEEIVKLFKYMSKDDITDIIGSSRIDIRKSILKVMKSGEKRAIHELLGYREDSAGGIMTTEYIALKSDLTIKDALSKIKLIGPKTEVIETILILNEDKELIGTADLRDILVEEEDKKILEICDTNVIYVEPDDDQEKVSLLVSKYDLKLIPVVNSKKHILGIITVDDIIDVIVEEQTEDILKLGGVTSEDKLDNSIGSSIKKRLPWLYVNLITAFAAAFTVALFEDVIVKVVALASVMPIIAGMGGNSGNQTLSIVIRGIALGEVDIKKNWNLIFKQIFLGLINGFAIGLVTGLIMYFKYQNPYLGLIIFLAMIGNMVVAGIFGFIVPLFLKKIGIDQALASSIFLTTATDVGGFLMFLGLAKLLLPLLI